MNVNNTSTKENHGNKFIKEYFPNLPNDIIRYIKECFF